MIGPNERVAVTGVPRAGKTTFATQTWRDVKSTDSTIDKGWSEASEAASKWFDEQGGLVVEGVAVPRALRKWLDRNPVGRPVDTLIWMDKPREVLSDGQASMGKGARTVLDEILPELKRRGVTVHFR